jgi:tRNA nucleotidyltransferase/poly(A) polymerase
MPNSAAQRAFAVEIVQKLRAAGFESLWAGGCVRDELLGLTPKDYDVATNATPDQIRDLFGQRRTLPIGAAFGVVTVLGPRAAGQIEVATFRKDAAYSDGRHPDSVTFTDAEHDAQRRDFTINGLFFDPIELKIVDYVDGQADIERRIIRAIGDPRLRLSEDKLRMLRAVRFAATFEFEIEQETFRAIQVMASEIRSVSAERIGMEIRRMLLDPNRATAVCLLRDTSLLFEVVPEAQRLSPDEFAATLRLLAELRQPTFPAAFAALLLELGGPGIEIGRRLRYPNKEIERANWLCWNVQMMVNARTMPWPTLQRVLTHPGAAELVALYEAKHGADEPALTFCRERLAWPAERLDPKPLLDGADLIRHGLPPGPQFSSLLEQVRDAQLNEEIGTQEEALAFVDRLRTDSNKLT